MKKIVNVLLCTFIILMSCAVAFADGGITLEISEAGYIDIMHPFSVKVTAYDMRKCDIYIGANKIAGGIAEEGVFETDADISMVPYIGNATVKAVAYLEGGTKIETSKEVYLVKMSDSINKYTQDFSGIDKEYESATSISILNMIFFAQGSSSLKPYDKGDGDIAAHIDMFKKSPSPFCYKAGLAIPDGALVEVNYDICFGSTDVYQGFELRDLDVKNPGPILGFFATGGSIGSTDYTYQADQWYSVKVIFDTFGNGSYATYVKGGDLAEYTLTGSGSALSGNGISQVRITYGSSNENGGDLYIDNLSVDYKTIANLCTFTPIFFESNEFSANTSSSVELAFSEMVSGVSAESVILKNASGDKLDATITLDSTATKCTITPSKKLAYGREYFIELTNGITVDSGNKLHLGNDLLFITEGAPNGIETALFVDGSLSVRLKDISALSSGRIVAVSYEDGAAKDVNCTEVDEFVEYFLTLTQTENVKIFLYDGLMLIDEVEL